VFHQKTEPLVEYYSNFEGVEFSRVEGLGSLDDVKAKVLKVLD
ncbi:MAG: adenylate kinase family enzyme, partial [Lentisphaeria bacterium]